MLIRTSVRGASCAAALPLPVLLPDPRSPLALSAVEGVPGPCAGLAARSEEAVCLS